MKLLFKKLPFIIILLFFSCRNQNEKNADFIIRKVNPKNENIEFFWKDDRNQILGSLGNLKKYLNTKNEDVKFAMNGGMFTQNQVPKGLFIQNYNIITQLDTLSSGKGNFYLQPNGIFYLNKKNQPGIVITKNYHQNPDIKFATQSGPMLIAHGIINPAFQKRSQNLNIRNGVGILENGEIVFAMSKKEVNFYNFAMLFQKMGCKDALYLDGFVSRTYLPEKNWMQEDGNFGVIIGVTQKY